ncbi:MAG: hypothetical protein ABI457_03135 [Hyphomicrobium sp.]
MQAANLHQHTYKQLVEVLTVCQYTADLCIKELEDKHWLEFIDGFPCLPDARPESMIIEHALMSSGPPSEMAAEWNAIKMACEDPNSA